MKAIILSVINDSPETSKPHHFLVIGKIFTLKKVLKNLFSTGFIDRQSFSGVNCNYLKIYVIIKHEIRFNFGQILFKYFLYW